MLGAAGRMANWFLPLSIAKETAGSTKSSLGRIGGSFRAMLFMLRDAWRLAREKSSEADMAKAVAELASIAPAMRQQFMRAAQGAWVLGVGMFLVGVALVGFAVWNSLTIMGTVGTGLAALLWAGFGVGYAMRSAADYHALATNRPVTGMSVLRDMALWVPRQRPG